MVRTCADDPPRSSRINVSGFSLECGVLRAIMDISARAFSLVLHRALPDLQRMKLLFCGRVVGTEVAIRLVQLSPFISWTGGS